MNKTTSLTIFMILSLSVTGLFGYGLISQIEILINWREWYSAPIEIQIVMLVLFAVFLLLFLFLDYIIIDSLVRTIIKSKRAN